MDLENGYTLIVYETKAGKQPFTKWISSLDSTARQIIRARIKRVQLRHLGDCKPIKGSGGVFELRIFSGPGYRVYFSFAGDKIVLLLCGGEKGSQDSDVEKATKYLRDWEARNGKNKNK